MKHASQFLTVLTLALVAGVVAAPAMAFDVDYSYPDQVQIDARTLKATHRLNAVSAWEAPASPRIGDVITFATKSDKLTPADVAKVKKVAALLKSAPLAGKHVIVNGYTDSVGKEAANQRLSYHRALSVVHALVAEGVPAASLSAQGFGASTPVATNSTPEGRAANRRVTFTVVCPPGM